MLRQFSSSLIFCIGNPTSTYTRTLEVKYSYDSGAVFRSMAGHSLGAKVDGTMKRTLEAVRKSNV